MAERGGKRTGAGRPKVKLSREAIPLKKVSAEAILASIDEAAFWNDLLTATTTTQVVVTTLDEDGQISGKPSEERITVPDYRIRLEAGKYLTDRRDGRPAQSLQHIGADGGAPTVNVNVQILGSGYLPTAKASRPLAALE